jgi:uncharacterized protein (TIGR02145 family)
MKRSFLFCPFIAFLLLFTCTLNSQEEYPNEGMPIRDLDGNVYRIIMTESGVWMAQNLNTFKLNDGTPIDIVYDNTKWESIKTPARGFFKNTVEYAETYGAIYNWYAVASGKLCPKGWHVPTQEEWNNLMDYAGGAQQSGDNPAKLKESGTKHWKAPNEGATNEIYFTALPAGEISRFSGDTEPGTETNWWTSTEDNQNLMPGEKPGNAVIVGLKYDFSSQTMGSFEKWCALPVRCKMNDE